MVWYQIIGPVGFLIAWLIILYFFFVHMPSRWERAIQIVAEEFARAMLEGRYSGGESPIAR